jgi:vanillate O-demethylase ferredoxin subunit
MTTITVTITSKTDVTPEVCALELQAADGRPLPAFTAGAHIDLHLPGGLVRQYSLYGAPSDTSRYRLAVLREPASRGGSVAVHALRAGQTLEISAPRNAFALAPQGPALLLGGGIGLTPLLAMAEQLHAEGRAFTLHLSVRSRPRLPLAAHLAAVPWAGRVQLHLDDEPATALALDAVLRAASADTHVYACGPAGYIAWARNAVQAAGWADARWHSESFTPPVINHSADGPFEI